MRSHSYARFTDHDDRSPDRRALAPTRSGPRAIARPVRDTRNDWVSLLGLFTIAALLTMLVVLSLFALVALFPATAHADGFVIIRPTPDFRDPEQLAVKSHLVDIRIRDQVARVDIDQIFHNPNRREVEGEYLFPVPEGAAVSDFTLWVDGKPVHAQAMDAEDALRIYEDLVRESKDPALLEYAGREIFRARIYPFPAKGDRRVALKYDHLIERQGGLYRFVYPLSTEKFSSAPLENASVSILLEADRPVLNAYCPTHHVEIDRLDSRRVRVSWEESGTIPDKDLVLFYSLADESMDMRLVPYRPDRNEDGYFMILASAGVDPRVQALPKDVIFVLDRSGSMEGEKIEQALEALIYCLENLDSNDRFNVIAFSSAVDAFANVLESATRREVREAVEFVEDIDASGGTNIEAALAEAMDARFDAERPAFVVFLSDGQPTVGETDVEKILDALPVRTTGGSERRRVGREAVRIFPFGLGFDVNAPFLDQLAIEHQGSPAYVRPSEDLRTSVAGFFDRIARPVMTDLELEVNGARVSDLEPFAIPDLFQGGQLVLFGRYRGSGPVEVSLSGWTGSRKHTIDLSTELPDRERENDFVGRLWATRRVGSLLRQVRIHGEERELVEEIKDLGLRFGIATPYTSFLVDENDRPLAYEERGRRMNYSAQGAPPAAAPNGRGQSLHARISDALGVGKGAGGSTMSLRDLGSTGEASFELSKKAGEMASAQTDADAGGQTLRKAAGRTFLKEGDVWKQTDCPADVKATKIRAGSAEYFDLIKAHPEIGQILALGERVVFEWEGIWYEVKGE